MSNYNLMNLMFGQPSVAMPSQWLGRPATGTATGAGAMDDVDFFSTRDRKSLSVTREGNDAVMTTPGGYTIKTSSRDKAEGGLLEITSPDGKTTTRVWGDPHVDKVSNGKTEHQMDFFGRTTFTLPDNTVITMNVKDKMLSDVMVTNGDQGVLSSNMLGGRNALQVDTGYGPMMDAMTGDGNVMHMGRDGEFYMDNEFGGSRKVTQKEVDERERLLGSGTGESTEASTQLSMKSIFAELRSLLGGFDSGFLSMMQSGSYRGSLSSNSSAGLFGMDLDTSTSSWY